MKKTVIFLKGLDAGKRKTVFDTGGNLMSFVTVCLISSVIFAVDYKFPEPNETAKFIKLVSLIPVLSISALPLALVKRNIRFTLLDLFSMLFLIYYLFSVFVRGTGDPIHLLLSIALSAIYVIVRATASGSNAGLKWIALAILTVSIFELILGLKQIYGYATSNHFRYSVTGSFFNPGPFGGYLAFIFSLSLSVLVKMRRKVDVFLSAVIQKRFKELISVDVPLCLVSFVTLFLSFILLPASMSRSAWMAVCVVLFIAIMEIGTLKRLKNWFSNRKRLLMPLAIIASLLVIVTIFGVYTLKKDSADARLFSWQISAKVIASNPVAGFGTGYFGGAFAKQQAQYFADNPESKYLYVADCPAYAFNEYLQIGTELGLTGLFLFLAVMFLAIRNVFIKSNPFQYGLIALSIFAFTSYPFRLVPLLVLFVVSMAAQKSKELPGRLTGKMFFVVISVAAFAVWIGLRPLMNEHIKAQTEWRKLQSLYRMDIYDAAGYEEIHALLKYNHKYLFEYGHALNKIGDNKKSNEILRRGSELSNDPMFHNILGNNYLAMKDYDNAEKSYKMAFNIVPSRIYPLYLLAKLYSEQGNRSKSLNMCKKVMDFRPKIHSPAVDELKVEVEELFNNLSILYNAD